MSMLVVCKCGNEIPVPELSVTADDFAPEPAELRQLALSLFADRMASYYFHAATDADVENEARLAWRDARRCLEVFERAGRERRT